MITIDDSRLLYDNIELRLKQLLTYPIVLEKVYLISNLIAEGEVRKGYITSEFKQKEYTDFLVAYKTLLTILPDRKYLDDIEKLGNFVIEYNHKGLLVFNDNITKLFDTARYLYELMEEKK